MFNSVQWGSIVFNSVQPFSPLCPLIVLIFLNPRMWHSIQKYSWTPSVNSVNIVNSFSSVNSVNSYSAVLPPYPMLFFLRRSSLNGLECWDWIGHHCIALVIGLLGTPFVPIRYSVSMVCQVFESGWVVTSSNVSGCRKSVQWGDRQQSGLSCLKPNLVPCERI